MATAVCSFKFLFTVVSKEYTIHVNANTTLAEINSEDEYMAAQDDFLESKQIKNLVEESFNPQVDLTTTILDWTTQNENPTVHLTPDQNLLVEESKAKVKDFQKQLHSLLKGQTKEENKKKSKKQKKKASKTNVNSQV